MTRRATNLGFAEAFGYGPHLESPDADEEAPANLLRYGVEYPDGRRASGVGDFTRGSCATLGFSDPQEPGPDPTTDLILTTGGGSGGSRQSERRCWVWPLPPESGEVRFVCEWPLPDTAESSAAIKATAIHEAAGRATEIWS